MTATGFDGRMEEAHTLAQIHGNVVVKIPLIKKGITALRSLADAEVATMPFETLTGLLEHPLTDRGLECFSEDWKDYQETRGKEPATPTA